MTYQELVAKAKEIYECVDASGIQEHVAYQFNIVGEGEGAFYLEISGGKIHVEPYEYYDRDAIITTTAENLLKIAAAELNPVHAYQTGEIRVEGNLGKAALLKDISSKAAEMAQKVEVVEIALVPEQEAAPVEAEPVLEVVEVEPEETVPEESPVEVTAEETQQAEEKAALEEIVKAEEKAAPEEIAETEEKTAPEEAVKAEEIAKEEAPASEAPAAEPKAPEKKAAAAKPAAKAPARKRAAKKASSNSKKTKKN